MSEWMSGGFWTRPLIFTMWFNANIIAYLIVQLTLHYVVLFAPLTVSLNQMCVSELTKVELHVSTHSTHIF